MHLRYTKVAGIRTVYENIVKNILTDTNEEKKIKGG